MAQCMAAQSLQTAAPSQPPQKSSGLSSQGNEDSAPTQDEDSQELSVAQMMMTLARASNKNMLAHNGGSSSTQNAPDK